MTIDEIKSKLANYTVGIAGAGGLGSNCAMALVRAGLTKIIVVDFDFVSESNLNRQFYFVDQIGMIKVEALKDNLLRINKNLHIEIVNLRIASDDVYDLFKDCSVVVEAFDDKNEKMMLIESLTETLPNMPIVVGSGMAGWGYNTTIKTEVFDNIYVCGDNELEVSEKLPPIGPRVGIVANMQANQVLEILLGKMF